MATPPVPCSLGDDTLWTEANSRSRRTNRIAAAICFGCPMRSDCVENAERQRTIAVGAAEFGGAWRPYGIWGGQLYDGTTQPPVAIMDVLA